MPVAESQSHPTTHSQSRAGAAVLLTRTLDGRVARARALLVGLEGMIGDIVRRLLRDEPSCEVIAEQPARAGLLEAIGRHRPNIVVVVLRQGDVGPGWDELFVRYPDLRVLAVTPDGRRACLFREPLEEGLITVLHGATTD